MRDIEIRSVLNKSILAKYHNDPDSKVVNEFSICQGIARVDIAVVNGSLHGYEIKSAYDNLLRLPNQIHLYSKVFDYITIITEQKHLNGIKEIVPKWVGIYICNNEGLTVDNVPDRNLIQDPHFIARMLWKEELIQLLNLYDIKFNSKDRNWVLCDKLIKNVDLPTLLDNVRKILKFRLS